MYLIGKTITENAENAAKYSQCYLVLPFPPTAICFLLQHRFKFQFDKCTPEIFFAKHHCTLHKLIIGNYSLNNARILALHQSVCV